jgi:hypothetical protein
MAPCERPLVVPGASAEILALVSAFADTGRLEIDCWDPHRVALGVMGAAKFLGFDALERTCREELARMVNCNGSRICYEAWRGCQDLGEVDLAQYFLITIQANWFNERSFFINALDADPEFRRHAFKVIWNAEYEDRDEEEVQQQLKRIRTDKWNN